MFEVDASLRAIPGFLGAKGELSGHLSKDLSLYGSGEIGYNFRNGGLDYAAILGLRGRF
jgi:hypothetical protein